MRRRVGRMAGAILATTLLMGMGAGVAHGSNWFGNTGATGCAGNNITDNATHVYYIDASVEYSQGAIRGHGAWVDNITETDAMYETRTKTENTDIIYFEKYYESHCGREWYTSGGSVIGSGTCYSTGSNGRCNMAQVRLDQGWTDHASSEDRRGLVSHETGHVLGLKHTSSGVMKTPLEFSWFYSTHDRAHLSSL